MDLLRSVHYVTDFSVIIDRNLAAGADANCLDFDLLH
jgi:hypothetical protein